MDKIILENILFDSSEYEEKLNIEKLNIPEQSFFVLLGEEDDIRPVILEIMCGQRFPDEGSVEINNDGDSEMKKIFRYVPDQIIYEDKITAGEYFELYHNKYYDTELEERMVEKIFNINKDEQLLNMTYQDNKIVALIAAIASCSDILILSEPGRYLERNVESELYELLEEMNKKGTTIIISTEDDKICEYGTDYAYVENGNIISTGKAIKEKELWKVVTVFEPEKEIMDEEFFQLLSENKNKKVYLCKKQDPDLLNEIIYDSSCKDFRVESVSFKEFIKKDFSEWM